MLKIISHIIQTVKQYYLLEEQPQAIVDQINLHELGLLFENNQSETVYDRTGTHNPHIPRLIRGTPEYWPIEGKKPVPEKKKILLADAFWKNISGHINQRKLERFLWQYLINQKFEIYVYQNPETAPVLVQDITTLMAAIRTMQPVANDQATSVFCKTRNVQKDQIDVVDHNRYITLMQKVINQIGPQLEREYFGESAVWIQKLKPNCLDFYSFSEPEIIELIQNTPGLTKIKLHTTLSMKILRVLTKYAPQLTSLQIENPHRYMNESWVQLIQEFKHLESLYLDFSEKLTDSQLNTFLKNLPYLKKLSVSGARITGAAFSGFDSPHSIKALSLRNCHQLTNDDLKRIVSAYSNIETLDLVYSNITDEGLEVLLENCPNIQELILDNTGITGSAFINMHKQLASIQYISFRSTALSDNGLAAMARVCPKIERLNLGHTEITDIGLQTLFENCPNIKKLVLVYTSITGAAFTTIKKWPIAIQSIDFGGCTSLLDEGLHAFLKACPNIPRLVLVNTNITGKAFKNTSLASTWLRFETNEKLTEEGLWALLTARPKLNKLDLHGTNITDTVLEGASKLDSIKEIYLYNSSITDKGLNLILKACPNVKNLDLRNTKITGAGFEGIGNLNSIKKINLGCSNVTDEELNLILKACPNLKDLKLFDTRITGSGFAGIGKLDSIESIDLFRSNVTDEELNLILKACPNLKDLKLFDTRITGSGFEGIGNLNSIKKINLGCSNVTDEELNLILKACPNLKDLELLGTRITCAAFEDIKSLPSMQRISFSEYPVPSRDLLQKVIEICPNLDRDHLISLHGKWRRSLGTSFEETEMQLAGSAAQRAFNDNLSYTPKTFSLTQTFLGNPPIDKSDERLRVYTSIEFSEDNNPIFNTSTIDALIPLAEESSLTRLPAQQIHHYFQSNPTVYRYYAQPTLRLSDTDWQALPSISAYDQLIAFEQETDVKFKRNPLTGQIFVKLKYPEISPRTIRYIIQANSDMIRSSTTKAVQSQFKPVSHPEIEKGFQSIGVDLSNADQKTKLDWLVHYFRTFREKDESDVYISDKKTGIEKLMDYIARKVGNCSIRSQGFLCLAHYLNIPARMVTNDCHAYVEVWDPEQEKWISIDLGGWPAEIKTHPLDVHTDEGAVVPFVINADYFFPPLIEKSDSAINQNASAFWSHWLQFSDVEISLSQDQAPEQVNVSLIQHLQAHHPTAKHIYLDIAKTLRNAKNAIVVRDGSYEEIKGLLSDILENESATDFDVIVINWAGFRPEEIAGYKSMLDTIRTLDGSVIPGGVRIVGITTPEVTQNTSEDFNRANHLTHFPVFNDPIDLYHQAFKNKPAAPSAFKVSLFSNPEWSSVLLGEIMIQKDQFEMKEGALIQAIKANAPSLHIHNPPLSEPSFQLFLQDILNKKRVWFNGEWLALPEGFTITYDLDYDPAALDTALQNCTFLRDDPTLPKARLFHLNSASLPLFYRINAIIDSKLDTHDQEGILQFYQETDDAIYVTHPLSSHQWAMLLLKHAKRRLRFIIAPSVVPSLPDFIAVSAPKKEGAEQPQPFDPAECIQCPNPVIHSSDPEFTVRQLKKMKDVLIVNLSPQIRSKELLQDMDLIRTGKTFEFPVWSQEILQALRAGKTVVINGLSPDYWAYKELESLLSSDPHLWLKGESKPGESLLNNRFSLLQSQGQLIVINAIDGNASSQIQNAAHLFDHQPSLSDYADELRALYPNQHHLIEQLFEFCNQTLTLISEHNALPTSKLPSPPYFTFSKLKSMLDDLISGHSIKPLFLNDFRSEPELYTAIKNLVRTQFSRHPGTPRLQKALDLLKRKPVLMLKGDPGVGKSYILPSLQEALGPNTTIYTGESAIQEWANDQADHYKILFLDEANFKPSDYWNFLKGLGERPSQILVNGKLLTLTKQHKIVMTGNFEHYPNRHYMDLVKKIGATLVFKPFNNEFLKEKIIKPIFDSHFQLNTDLIAMILDIYTKAQTINLNYIYSTRDLQMLCLRILAKIKAQPVAPNLDDLQAIIAQSAVNEFFGVLDESQQEELMASLPATLQESNEYAEVEKKLEEQKFYMTPHFSRANQAVLSDLEVRQLLIDNPSLIDKGKRGHLMEGLSGIGKSMYSRKLLIAAGYQLVTVNTDPSQIKDTQKAFYCITSGDKEKMVAILEKAFDQGSIVLIDELNILDLEEVLNQWLTGFRPGKRTLADLYSLRAKKEGFFVLATQNPTSFSGRRVFSDAYRNRWHMQYVPDSSPDDLRSIIQKMAGENAEAKALVEWYLELSDYFVTRHLKPIPTQRQLLKATQDLLTEGTSLRAVQDQYFKKQEIALRELDLK